MAECKAGSIRQEAPLLGYHMLKGANIPSNS
jgi:hypothetical protein